MPGIFEEARQHEISGISDTFIRKTEKTYGSHKDTFSRSEPMQGYHMPSIRVQVEIIWHPTCKLSWQQTKPLARYLSLARPRRQKSQRLPPKIRRIKLAISCDLEPLPFKPDEFTLDDPFVKKITETGLRIV